MDELTPDICETVQSPVVYFTVTEGGKTVYKESSNTGGDLCAELRAYENVQFVIKVPPEVYFSQLPTQLELTQESDNVRFYINLDPSLDNTVTYNNKLYTYAGTKDKLHNVTKKYCIEPEWCKITGSTTDHVSVCNMDGWAKLGTAWDSIIHLDGVQELYEEYVKDGHNTLAYSPTDVYHKLSANRILHADTV